MATNPPVETRYKCTGCRWQGDARAANVTATGWRCPRCTVFYAVQPLDPLPSVTPETYSAEELDQAARYLQWKSLLSDAEQPEIDAEHAAMLRYAATLVRENVELKAERDELQTCNDNLTANLEEMTYLREIAERKQ